MNSVTIQSASDLLDVSPDTIRRWEKKGLIKSHRDEHNYRTFDLDEISRLNNKLKHGISSENHYSILRSNKENGFKTIELFAGAGGTALGFSHAGFEHVMLNEIEKDASTTLINNRPDWNVIQEDIRNLDFRHYQADVVQGGFPCQSFSYAGKGLGFGDTRGTLFFEFVRAVKKIRPIIAVGENVRGLLNHDSGRTLKTMVKELESAGYRVAYRVLRAQYLDVPQKRERLIIFGIRNDHTRNFVFPKEKDYTISLREALQDVPPSDGQRYPEKKHNVLKLVPPGGYWRNLPPDIQKDFMGASYYLGGGKTGMARRLSWDEPSLTLTCSPAQKQTERCHPDETRPLTIREYARIQTFPDDWKFSGSVTSQYKQIGNAVPVNFGYHIAKSVEAMITGNVDRETQISLD